MSKKKSDALATNFHSVGRELTEFAKQAEKNGAALIEAGLDKFKKDEQDRIVGKVNELIKHIRSLYASRDKLDAEIRLFEGRLKQVNEGQFKVDSMGMIHFEDGFYL